MAAPRGPLKFSKQATYNGHKVVNGSAIFTRYILVRYKWEQMAGQWYLYRVPTIAERVVKDESAYELLPSGNRGILLDIFSTLQAAKKAAERSWQSEDL